MPIDQLFCLGISHKTGHIDKRERMKTAVLPLTTHHPIILLTTCNRVELYTTSRALLNEALAAVKAHHLADAAYRLEGQAAARHLLRVAAGLESMVLGEAQILGQVRIAWQSAMAHQQLPLSLSQLFKTAIRTGKRVRTETDIARYPGSMSAIALQQVRNAQGSLQEKRFLIVGLGEMGGVTLKALRARGYEHVDLANRTISKAKALLSNGNRAYGLGELESAVLQNDIVFCAARVSDPLITLAMAQRIMAQRNGRFLTLVDLAVPRNVDPEVNALPNCNVIDVDQLQTNLDDALAARKTAVPAAEAMIETELTQLETELKSLAVTPTIKALREKAESIRQMEVNRTLKHLHHVDEQTKRHIEHLSQSLVNKLLHAPTQQLRTEAKAGRTESAVANLRTLFDLEE